VPFNTNTIFIAKAQRVQRTQSEYKEENHFFSAESPLSGFAEWGTRRLFGLP
jgi:hypothetical protein